MPSTSSKYGHHIIIYINAAMSSHMSFTDHMSHDIIGPLREKTCLRVFLTKRDSNKSPHLQRLARKLKFHLWQVYIWYFAKSDNKGADQTARMRRLVCACVVRQLPEDRFSRGEAHMFSNNVAF